MKSWIGRHIFASLAAVLVAGTAIGGGAAVSTSDESELRQDLRRVQSDLVSARSSANDAQDDLAASQSRALDLEDDINQLEARLTNVDAEWKRIDEEKSELADLRATLDARAARLARSTQRVKDLEAKLRRELHRVNSSTIVDGIWQIGVDVQPGLYRAPGGAGCYWALLNSANTSDIANNGGFGPNQTIELMSGWFESSDCGEWKKIG